MVDDLQNTKWPRTHGRSGRHSGDDSLMDGWMDGWMDGSFQVVSIPAGYTCTSSFTTPESSSRPSSHTPLAFITLPSTLTGLFLVSYSSLNPPRSLGPTQAQTERESGNLLPYFIPRLLAQISLLDLPCVAPPNSTLGQLVELVSRARCCSSFSFFFLFLLSTRYPTPVVKSWFALLLVLM